MEEETEEETHFPDLSPETVADSIKNDFNQWQRMLCSGSSSPLEVATMTIDVLERQLLPRHKWNEKTAGIQQAKMYVLEQSFLDQV